MTAESGCFSSTTWGPVSTSHAGQFPAGPVNSKCVLMLQVPAHQGSPPTRAHASLVRPVCDGDHTALALHTLSASAQSIFLLVSPLLLSLLRAHSALLPLSRDPEDMLGPCFPERGGGRDVWGVQKAALDILGLEQLLCSPI